MPPTSHARCLPPSRASRLRRPPQAICACRWHFVRAESGALPGFDPVKAKPRCSVLYTHMYYNPGVLAHFMPRAATVRLITILRAPLDVLKSAQKMAIVQHREAPKLNNTFCQLLAGSTERWLRRCPMAATGDSSVLQYLDTDGHKALQALLNAAKRSSGSVDLAAADACMAKARQRLDSDFIVGLQVRL